MIDLGGLDALLRQLHEGLTRQKATVATAESCTGGMLAALLTERSGSSAFYLGGMSVYANAAKVALLGVDPATLQRHGAVSAEVAAQMAEGARTRLAATYAVALTGVAGPDGGSPEKPVGTVFCGVAGPRGTRVVRWALAGDRSQVRQAAAAAALRELAAEICN